MWMCGMHFRRRLRCRGKTQDVKNKQKKPEVILFPLPDVNKVCVVLLELLPECSWQPIRHTRGRQTQQSRQGVNVKSY